MTPFDTCLLGATDILSAAIRTLVTGDAAALPLLAPADRARLTRAACSLEFRRARPVVGDGAKAVYQDFDICTDVPEDGPFGALADTLSAEIGTALQAMDDPPLAPPFRFNDRVLQRYAAGSQGISPHRDHIRYEGLVAIVVVAGDGRFYLSRDRKGQACREIAAPAGHLILMRAPGFAGGRERPFHGLERVGRERLSLGLRLDAKSA